MVVVAAHPPIRPVPLPSSLPLQGREGFSRSSSELSSSEGVWLPRKWKENERHRDKMEKTGEVESFYAKTLLLKLILQELD